MGYLSIPCNHLQFPLSAYNSFIILVWFLSKCFPFLMQFQKGLFSLSFWYFIVSAKKCNRFLYVNLTSNYLDDFFISSCSFGVGFPRFLSIQYHVICIWAYQVALVVKNLPTSARDIRHVGQEDPLEESMATHSSILAWRIPGQRSLASYSP